MENFESIPPARVEVKPEFNDFVPQGFLDDPVGYFELYGKNIKAGEKKVDETGVVREDPTAVKDLPVWKDLQGKEIKTVGKRVNTSKGAVGESDDPFYEYGILELLALMKLPAAKPIAKAEQGDALIMIMERIPGIRWSERSSLRLLERGYTEQDVQDLMTQAEHRMNELKDRFDAAGIIRSWKLKDMVLDIDIENKRILSVMPTDWERTRVVYKK